MRLNCAVFVMAPLVPLRVMAAEYAVADDDAAAVSFNEAVPPGAIDAGVKTAVTPIGTPDAARVTLPVKLLMAATLTGVVVEDPATTLTGAALAPSVKLDTGATVRVSGNEAVSAPLVPVIVTTADVDVAVAGAVNATDAVPPAEGDVGEKLAVTPAGNPDAANATLPWKPLAPTTAIPTVTDEPAGTVKEDGDALSVKLGGACACVTVNVSPAMISVPVRGEPALAAAE